jgi:hypothetical protein
MNEVLQTNVFFFIASIAVIVFTVFLCIVLYQIIKLLCTVRQIAKRIEAGSELVTQNLENLKNYFKDASFLKSIIGGIFGLHTYEKKSVRKPRRKKIKVEEDIDNDIS